MGRIAFVLSGGGARGSFQVGAIDYLVKDGRLDPDVIVGVSTGALNASFIAQAPPHEMPGYADGLEAIWFALRGNGDIYRKRLFGKLGLLFGAKSVYSFEPLKEKIREHLDPGKLTASGRELRVGTVELRSGCYVVATQSDPNIRDMVYASSSVPVVAECVPIGEDSFVDGGVRNITPLEEAFDALAMLRGNQLSDLEDPDRIFVLLASPLSVQETDASDLESGLEVGERALELVENEIYINDLHVASSINDAVRHALTPPLDKEAPFAKHHYAPLCVVEPDDYYMETLEFDPDKIRRAFEAGRKKAASVIEQFAQSGDPLECSNAREIVSAKRPS